MGPDTSITGTGAKGRLLCAGPVRTGKRASGAYNGKAEHDRISAGDAGGRPRSGAPRGGANTETVRRMTDAVSTEKTDSTEK